LKKKTYLLFIIMIFIMIIMINIICGSKDLGIVFKGGSENWLGSYVVSNSPKEDYFIGKWKLIYVGKNKPQNDTVKYVITGESIDVEATDKLFGYLEGSTSTYFLNKDESINVVIEWDNYKETLTLKHK